MSDKSKTRNVWRGFTLNELEIPVDIGGTVIAVPVETINTDSGDGFPEGQTGMLSGTNALFRPNYFNGRFLTARTLQSEQVYWDHRARFPAQDKCAWDFLGIGAATHRYGGRFL